MQSLRSLVQSRWACGEHLCRFSQLATMLIPRWCGPLRSAQSRSSVMLLRHPIDSPVDVRPVSALSWDGKRQDSFFLRSYALPIRKRNLPIYASQCVRLASHHSPSGCCALLQCSILLPAERHWTLLSGVSRPSHCEQERRLFCAPRPCGRLRRLILPLVARDSAFSFRCCSP